MRFLEFLILCQKKMFKVCPFLPQISPGTNILTTPLVLIKLKIKYLCYLARGKPFMNVTISGPADVFGAFRELVSDLGALVGKGNFQHIIHDYGHLWNYFRSHIVFPLHGGFFRKFSLTLFSLSQGYFSSKKWFVRFVFSNILCEI